MRYNWKDIDDLTLYSSNNLHTCECLKYKTLLISSAHIMAVITVENDGDFQQKLSEAGPKLVVAQMTASW